MHASPARSFPDAESAPRFQISQLVLQCADTLGIISCRICRFSSREEDNGSSQSTELWDALLERRFETSRQAIFRCSEGLRQVHFQGDFQAHF